MRATIAIDDALFKEAFSVSNAKKEYVRKKRLKHLAGMYSSGAVTMTCEELEEYRSDDK